MLEVRLSVGLRGETPIPHKPGEGGELRLLSLRTTTGARLKVEALGAREKVQWGGGGTRLACD